MQIRVGLFYSDGIPINGYGSVGEDFAGYHIDHIDIGNQQIVLGSGTGEKRQ